MTMYKVVQMCAGGNMANNLTLKQARKQAEEWAAWYSSYNTNIYEKKTGVLDKLVETWFNRKKLGGCNEAN